MIAEENTRSKRKPTDEPIDVLVNLARDGEIDPWDIDIVTVTDKFLERLDETDLGRTGKGILYASILLRMKSDYIVEGGPEEEEDPSMGWDAPREEDWELHDDPINDLERELDRRMKRRSVRDQSRPETLDELIREIRTRERDSWWKESREYRKDSPETPMGPDGAPIPEPTLEDATGTAHEDEIEHRIDDVWSRLEEEFQHRREVLFRELLDRDSSKTDSIITYICILFLTQRDKVELEQDDFYGDLWVRQKDS